MTHNAALSVDQLLIDAELDQPTRFVCMHIWSPDPTCTVPSVAFDLVKLALPSSSSLCPCAR